MGNLRRIRWWHWIPRFYWRVVAVVEHGDEVPTSIPRKGMVLVGCRETPKWLAFDCPCRIKHRMMVNLDPRRSPSWKLSSEKRLTIWPSFDYRGGTRQRCHVLITRGRVVWVTATDKEQVG